MFAGYFRDSFPLHYPLHVISKLVDLLNQESNYYQFEYHDDTDNISNGTIWRILGETMSEEISHKYAH